MCNTNDMSGDEDAKPCFVSKISAGENDSKIAKSTETSANIDQTKLKHERAELVEHLYNIMRVNSTRDMKRLREMRKSAEKDRRKARPRPHWHAGRFVKRAFRKKVRTFRPRKMSRTLCVTERGRKISRLDREMEYYRENQAPKDNRKKKALRNRFYDKRKKERDLNRRANGREKFENLGILREDSETEDEIFLYGDYTNYKVKENDIPEKFALSEENACEELRDMIEFFLDLQDREITPEDFDFLLRLDESVPAKTLSEQRVASLEKQPVIEQYVDEVCGICMENYVVGETRKILPCKHAFHLHCIDTWLSKRSTKCPLDSGEV